jgi:hypothetical protein
LGWLATLLLIAATAAAQSARDLPLEEPSIPECENVGHGTSHGEALVKVCEYAATLPHRIPNFSCEQKTSRFLNGQAADIVTARVTYTDGKESYQDIRTSKGPVTDPALPKIGTWSTGQFESDIRAIFIGGNQTIWRFAGDDNVDGRPALIFHYEIPRQDTPLWQLHMQGLSAAPPYKGELWIDPETSAPLRLDVSATELPPDFPIRSAEIEMFCAAGQIHRGQHRNRRPAEPQCSGVPELSQVPGDSANGAGELNEAGHETAIKNLVAIGLETRPSFAAQADQPRVDPGS